MMLVEESPVTIGLHLGTLLSTMAILGLLLNQHKVWIRLKDRVNTMWRHHCAKTGDPYESLDNGSH